MKNTHNWVAYSKPVIFLLLLLPTIWLGLMAYQNQLGADPAKRLVDETGLWAFRILLLSLLMTPLKNWTGRSVWIRYRRMIGLFTLFYVVMHLLIYVFLLFGADWTLLGKEITKRPYIIVGLLAFALLLPLGVTSTRNWQKRLGRNWLRLHKTIYVISLLALWHFSWVKKLGIASIWPYALILAVLLGERVRMVYQRRQHRAAISASEES
jgi:sulfoxide reductase heme-binding subunit YedZ